MNKNMKNFRGAPAKIFVKKMLRLKDEEINNFTSNTSHFKNISAGMHLKPGINKYVYLLASK